MSTEKLTHKTPSKITVIEQPPSITMTKPTEAPPVVQPRQPQAKRCVAVVLLVFILLTLLFVVVIWLAVQPKKLIYSIEHSSINGYSSGGGGANSTFHCLLRSKNPNKRVSFYFKRIEVEATYYGKKLFVGNVGPFGQPVRNVTDLEVDVPAVGGALRGKTAEQLSSERAAGSAKLEVKVVGKINMKIGVFKVHRTVTANCGPYDVPFSESKGFRRIVCDTDISY